METKLIDVKVDFTDNEINEFAKDVASQLRERDNLISQRKASNDSFKTQISVVDGEITDLVKKINQGYHFVPTPCYLHHFDEETKEKVWFSTAAEEEVLREAVIPKQASLFEDGSQDDENENTQEDDEPKAVHFNECPNCSKIFDGFEYEKQFCPDCGWKGEMDENITPNDDPEPDSIEFDDDVALCGKCGTIMIRQDNGAFRCGYCSDDEDEDGEEF